MSVPESASGGHGPRSENEICQKRGVSVPKTRRRQPAACHLPAQPGARIKTGSMSAYHICGPGFHGRVVVAQDAIAQASWHRRWRVRKVDMLVPASGCSSKSRMGGGEKIGAPLKPAVATSALRRLYSATIPRRRILPAEASRFRKAEGRGGEVVAVCSFDSASSAIVSTLK